MLQWKKPKKTPLSSYHQSLSLSQALGSDMAVSWWKFLFISFVFLAVVVPEVKADSGSSLDDEVEAVRSDVPTSQELEQLKSKIQTLGWL